MTRAIDRRRVLKLGALAAGSTLGFSRAAEAAAHRCTSALAQSCAVVVRRPEVGELTPDQWNRFTRAVKEMAGTTGAGSYHSAVAIGYNNSARWRGVAAFLPWLRVYLRRFEQALQRADPSVVLPYWDWTRDSKSPGTSRMLSSSYFGGTGRPSDGTVVGGSFANWKCTIPDDHFLRRSGDKVPSFYSAEGIESILIRATSYDSLRRNLEGASFDAVLTSIGGRNGDMSFRYAPNDPLFWVVACFTGRNGRSGTPRWPAPITAGRSP
ncbi:tyrosinase family protein [Streptomyces kutzneri]|uniref:tyrosinase family protein n=1 Tax=Streptomyces kutzneri TaxID=3051179 RepID=UPI0034D95D98